jgi:hypothetical protein
MSDDTPILTNQQRALSIKLRLKAEKATQDAQRRYERSLKAIAKQYRTDMYRNGLGVLLEGKQK